MVSDDRYLSGEYLASSGGTWHLEDSPFKAEQAMKMITRHGLRPRTVVDIGCGAGGVLAQLRHRLPGGTETDTKFVGYDVSPQAHQISRQFEQDNLRFVLGDAFEDPAIADLVLVFDVVEHIEDCFGLLRKIKAKGEYKLYHIPLDISVTAALRDSFMRAWHLVGHVHVFSEKLALETLRSTGHEVIDSFFTPGGLRTGRGLRAFLGNLPRRVLPQRLAARLVGGFSLLVLAR
jgi:SAM-dependent methyltransferase